MNIINSRTKINPSKSIAFPILLGLGLLVGVCTAGHAQQADSWQDDLQSLDLGHAMVEKGNENLHAGRNLVREGQDKISTANDAVRLGREKYRQLLTTTIPSEKIATELAAVQDDITSNLDQIAAGNSMVERGEKLIKKGREQVTDGRLTIDAGYLKTRKTKRAVEFRLMLPEKSVLEN